MFVLEGYSFLFTGLGITHAHYLIRYALDVIVSLLKKRDSLNFTSITFLTIILPAFLLLSFLFSRYQRTHNIFLILASLLLYAFGDIRYIPLLITSITTNYLLAMGINHGLTYTRTRLTRGVLAGALIFNLGLLIVFKYAHFVGDSISWIAGLFSDQFTYQLPSSLNHFPIGISFFTFSAITYIMDIYRRKVPFDHNPLASALYISFFPKILMGPIITYKDMAPQIRQQRTITIDNVLYGLKSFIIGLGKKVLIANTLAAAANQIFNYSAGQLTAASAWLGVVCYTLQIYFDFSGYTDMAIGIARMTGFDIPGNFNYPYLSKSIREFWQRWHITLGKWFLEYLYIPLGGNRRGPVRTYVNLLIVFFLCGLWHSPSWTFVIWGLWHGLFMILERANIIRVEGRWRLVGSIYSLVVVMIGWVIFRSSSISQGVSYLGAMFGITHDTTKISIDMLINTRLISVFFIGIIGCFPIVPLIAKSISQLKIRFIPGIGRLMDTGFFIVHSAILFGILILSGITLAGSSYMPFIYAQF